MRTFAGAEARYSHPTIVRHQGVVIVLAQETVQSGVPPIRYRMLATDPLVPDDDMNWSVLDTLAFPEQLRPAGMSLLTVEAAATARPAPNTAFQAVSDGRHVYLFRQSADSTLYADRFVMDAEGRTLLGDVEPRFQRSKKRDLPAGEKDTLGTRDMERKPFFEPTLELALDTPIANGRFAVCIVPARPPTPARWLIASCDNATITLTSIRRAEDGLFDMRDVRTVQYTLRSEQGAKLGLLDAPALQLYHQQETSDGQYHAGRKLKREARLLLALVTGKIMSPDERRLAEEGGLGPDASLSEERRLAVLDFGVLSDGTLAAIGEAGAAPAAVTLPLLAAAADNTPLALPTVGAAPLWPLLPSAHGALLGFAAPQGTPFALEGADGLVRLYFQGAGNLLHAAQLDTTVARATYRLPLDKGAALRFVATRPGTRLNGATIAITDVRDDTCTLAITAADGASETWPNLPRDPQLFVKVLGGGASANAADPRVASGELVLYDDTQVARHGVVGPAQVCTLFGVSIEAMPEDGALAALNAGTASRVADGASCGWQAEQSGKALDLPLTPTLPMQAAVKGPIVGDVTFETWIKLSRQRADGQPIRRILHYNQSGVQPFSIGIHPADESTNPGVFDEYLLFATAGGQGRTVKPNGPRLKVGTWTHIAAVYNTTGALKLDGDRESFVRCGKAAEFNTGAALSLEAWVRPGSRKAQQAIIAKWGETAIEQSWLLALDAENRPYFRAHPDSGDDIIVTGTTGLMSGKDTHLAAIFDAEERKEAALWVDYQMGVFDSYATVASYDAIDFKRSDDMTVELWLNTAGLQVVKHDGSGHSVLEKWDSNKSKGFPFAIRYFADGTICGVRSNGPKDAVVASKTNINDKQFHHVAFVKRGEELELYVDGVLEATAADITGDESATQNDVPLHLGVRSGGMNGFRGWINDVRIWQTARSPQQIRHNIYKLGKKTGLVGYWPLNDKLRAGQTGIENVEGLRINSPARMLDVDKSSYMARLLVNGAEVARQSIPRGTAIRDTSTAVMIGRIEVTKPTSAPMSFEGMLDEVRLWNAPLLPVTVLGGMNDGPDMDTEGLVASWGFEEPSGAVAFDAKGQNHGIINYRLPKQVDLLRTRNYERSHWTFAIDGEAVDRAHLRDLTLTKPAEGERISLNSLDYGIQQFTLAGVGRSAGSQVSEYLRGALDETRIWNSVRTPEELADNRFTPLVGDEAGLLCYWRWDEREGALVRDGTGNGFDVTLPDSTSLQLTPSDAPLGNEGPVVRHAYGGRQREGVAQIAGMPCAAEYGDMQRDADGNLMAVLKRCYVIPKAGGAIELVAGFKVGELEQQFVSQIQTEPTLVGFIEGAPPVPSENLTNGDPESDSYSGASMVELTEANETVQLFAASKSTSDDYTRDIQAGFYGTTSLDGEIAPGWSVNVVSLENKVGYHGLFEESFGWSSEASASTGVTRTLTKSLALAGRWEAPQDYDQNDTPRFLNTSVGRRFVPDNVGYALVKSGTADLFALRHRLSGGLVAYQAVPNPDIPEDWNIIMFPIDPTYVKNGTLDGMVGTVEDPHYRGAQDGNRGSYFKPLEAYALKKQIERQNKRMDNRYNSFDAAAAGQDETVRNGTMQAALVERLGQDYATGKAKRSMVNTYVWTAAGGFYAEEEQFSSVMQESLGGSYNLVQGDGLVSDTSLSVFGVGFFVTSDTLWGSSLNVAVTQQRETSAQFGMQVSVDCDGTLERWDDQRNKYVPIPGKVDAYRFMSFYLAPGRENFDAFFERVVDQDWLNGRGAYAGIFDPNAQAMRAVRFRTNEVWRVMHRVTYVSRVPEQFTAVPLETVAPDVRAPNNMEGNAVLIDAVATRARALPAGNAPLLARLGPLFDRMAPIADNTASDLARQLPWWTKVHPDQRKELRRDLAAYMHAYAAYAPGALTPAGRAQQSQPALLSNDNRHPAVLANGAAHPALLAESAVPAAEDPSISVVPGIHVPVVSAKGAFHPDTPMLATLEAQVITGANTGELKLQWRKLSGPGEVLFDTPNSAGTRALFRESGTYRLGFSAENYRGGGMAALMVHIHGRARDGLLALYTFDDDPSTARDVSSRRPALDLTSASELSASSEAPSSVAVLGGIRLQSSLPAARIAERVAVSDAITLEAWLHPTDQIQPGLARIVTISGGPGARNLTLGQRGEQYYVALRTSETGPNAAEQALMAGRVNARTMNHVVFTRAKDGTARLYVNGVLAGERTITGKLNTWDHSFPLALGDELNSDDGIDRAWAGNYHLVALYDRALTASEVAANNANGADANLPPLLTIDAPATARVGETARLAVTLADDRLPAEQFMLAWEQAAGPAATITPAGGDVLDVTFTQPGVHQFWVSAASGAQKSIAAAVVAVYDLPAVAITAEAEGVVATAMHAVVPLDGDAPVRVQLAARVTASGRPVASGKPYSYAWAVTQAPAGATPVATTADTAATTVELSAPGRYQVTLRCGNGFAERVVEYDLLAVRPPVVTLPERTAVELKAQEVFVELTPVVKDSGAGDIAQPLAYEARWAGPAPVNARVENGSIHAGFGAVGRYTLTLVASNGRRGEPITAEVVVHRLPQIDIAPVPQRTFPAPAVLDAVVSDDGMPGARLAFEWSDSTGRVEFADRHATYTTARFPSSGVYTLTLTADDGVRPAQQANVQVTVLPAPRVAGELALFRFEKPAIKAHRVANGAAGQPALDLDIQSQGAPQALDPIGLLLHGKTAAISTTAAGTLADAVTARPAITVEAWLRPKEVTLGENKTRTIVTMSAGSDSRNITLAQEADGFRVRVRDGADVKGLNGSLGVRGAIAREADGAALTHVVYTLDTTGDKRPRLYVNGVAAQPTGASAQAVQNLANWARDFKLAVGSEPDGKEQWSGEVYLVAIYNRALSAEEVRSNYDAKF
jgi:hypothetical protein